MIVVAVIIDGPLQREGEHAALAGTAAELKALTDGGSVGATLRFEGIVRRNELSAYHGREQALRALHYQTYDPMAQGGLEALARETGEKHGLLSIITLHSRGNVNVGEVSFVLEVAAPHRAEALAAMTDFIDRLKQDVPIWKQPVWAD